LPEDERNQDQSPEGEGREDLQARIAELEGLVAGRGEELKARDARLGEAKARVTELEQLVAERDSELADLRQTLSETEGELSEGRNSLAQAVAGYRALAVQANPGILDELVTGDSIEAISQSLESSAEDST